MEYLLLLFIPVAIFLGLLLDDGSDTYPPGY
jgi:hypothetical protein